MPSTSYADQAAVNTGQDVKGDYNGGHKDSILVPSAISTSRVPHALKCDWSIMNGSSEESVSYSGKLTVHSDGTLHIEPVPDENISKLSASNSILKWFPGQEISYSTEAVGHVLVNKHKIDLFNALRHIDPDIRGISIDGDTVYRYRVE